MAYVWIGILVVLYVSLLVAFAWFLLKPLLLLGTAIMIVLVCGRYFQALGENLFWGTGAPERISGPEPAFMSYMFDKAWRDYVLIVLRAKDLLIADARRLIGWGRSMMNPFAWFLGLTLWVVTFASAISGAAVVLFAGLVHVLVVGLLAALAYTSALLFLLSEQVSMAVRRIHGRCPECHQPLSLPVYACQCGARHARLIPGAYGSIYRRCRCGKELPTLFLFGRNQLQAICPRCDKPVNRAILTVRDVFIPIVGGVSTGKSSLLTASLTEFEHARSGLIVSFPKTVSQSESADERNYKGVRAQYGRGERVAKTVSGAAVRALQVCLEDAQRRKRLIYAYDAAGETHKDEHQSGSLPYYSHIHGLFFLIDPFSLEGQRSRPLGLAGSLSALSPSIDSPQDVFDHVVGSLKKYSKRRTISRIPVAVLVTKTDALGIRAEILKTEVKLPPGKEANSEAEAQSYAIKEWLIQNGALSVINSLETSFCNVRYFEGSALGRIPGQDSSPFKPYGVLEPWAWVLGKSGLKINTPTARSAK